MAGMPQKTNQHHHAQQSPHQQQRHGRPQHKAIQIEDEQHSGHQQGVGPGHGRGERKPVDSAWPTVTAPSTATYGRSAATPAPAAGSWYNLRTIIIQQTLGLAGLSL
jgi:hypothetical protein